MKSELLAQRLHDIRGLDPVSPWPPAPGWWLLLLGAILLAFLAVYVWRTLWTLRNLPRGSWRRDAHDRLLALRRELEHAEDKQVAAELSEILRRIAIAQCGREACAGLSGERWLQWLGENDPFGFDWPARGRLLLDLAYAPQTDASHGPQLLELLDAALPWTMARGLCAGGGR